MDFLKNVHQAKNFFTNLKVFTKTLKWEEKRKKKCAEKFTGKTGEKVNHNKHERTYKTYW
jgi:hypothetical protein